MTKGGNSKSKMLGRLIFGEKRKQQVASSRHRSATRNGSNVPDAKSSGGGTANKDPINIHDWAIWRMHLNEQMGNEMTDTVDLKQLRQFLQSNPFYQQHSRDPSNGRYNGVQLLFSIPHAKIQTETNDGSRGGLDKNSQTNLAEAKVYDQNKAHPNIDDRSTTGVNSVSAGPPMLVDKTISQLLPKNLTGNTAGFLHVNEQMIAADAAQTRRSMRTSYIASDRVHSTLQKAVKDGNVLEKIKAFEMQAAAVQAGMTPTLGRSSGANGGYNTMNKRMPIVTSSIPSIAHRTLSPAGVRPIHHPISPVPMQHELQQQQQQQQQQYIRPHRSRHVHPVQHRRDGHSGPMIGRESRKGAHVLEPAHGDIILKRRTPSQKTINDEDYSMTMMSSMALTASQGQHPRQHHHHHHRTSASRSRHRQDTVHDKRSSSHHDHGHKKHAQKQKETTTATPSSSNKTNTRRWLIGRKEITTENGKQNLPTTKSSKADKNKKKNNEKRKSESSKKATSPDPKGKVVSTSDQNRVYDVPTPNINDQTKAAPISTQPPSRIDEENESEREEKTAENKTIYLQAKDEEKCDTITTNNVQRRTSQMKKHQRLVSTDGEIISKIEDDTRNSRPTDDHAHRSELLDEDDECRSEGDVFLEESSVTNTTQHHANQCPVEGSSSDRRWQWSKESGGLIEIGHGKKKQSATTLVSHGNEEEQVVYEIPQSEQTSLSKFEKTHSSSLIIPSETKNESNNGKQILHTIINSKTPNEEKTITDEFFDNGPYTNPEEITANKTSTA